MHLSNRTVISFKFKNWVHRKISASILIIFIMVCNLFRQAGMWLKHGSCLHQVGDLEDAAISYAAVLISVPQYTEARLKLVEVHVYIALG